ncbi:uncharacterized protein PHACADRAFT_266542, partial [Phanerochaete carnosa HHB-10118-sp]
MFPEPAEVCRRRLIRGIDKDKFIIRLMRADLARGQYCGYCFQRQLRRRIFGPYSCALDWLTSSTTSIACEARMHLIKSPKQI